MHEHGFFAFRLTRPLSCMLGASFASPMPGLKVDDSRWPAVVTHVPPGDHTDEEIHASMDDYLRIVRARKQPFVTITDLTRGTGMSPKQRRIITDFMQKHEDELAVHCRGAAMVFQSAVMRGMLTAIFWIAKPRWETRVFATLDEAGSWAHEKSREEPVAANG